MSETKRCPYCNEEINAQAKKCKHCGEWLEEKEPVSSGTTIIAAFSQQYEVLEEIGRGGMAVVYKARQKSLDRIVALKVIPKEFTHDQEFVKRFKKEARDGAKLNHPNIFTVYDSGEIYGYPYMAMEYLEGGTLRQKIKEKINKGQDKSDINGGLFSEEEIKKILIPILEGLGYAHEQGLIHRDIKSSNIMFDKKGRPVLMDFGIAKSMEGTRLTKTGTYMGTPEYSSPEQADTQKTVDHRTDIYSMGVVAYEMATGSVPFKGDNPMAVLMDVITKQPTYVGDLATKLSSGFANAIMKALLKDLEKRYNNCEDFIKGLKEGESYAQYDNVRKQKEKNYKTNEHIKTPTKSTEKKSKVKSYLFIGLTLILLGIIGVSLYAYISNIKDKNAWELAKDKNSKSAYENYMDLHPDGDFYSEAYRLFQGFEQREKKEKEKELAIAKQNKKKKLEELNNKKLNAKKEKERKNRIKAEKKSNEIQANKLEQKRLDRLKKEKITWEQSKAKNTIISYRNYLSQYPNGQFVDTAKQKIKDLEELQKTQTIEEEAPDEPETVNRNISAAEVFSVVDVMPTFPGGMGNLMSFLINNIKYPPIAKESGVRGIVFVNFIVEPNGDISHVKVLRGIGSGCDEEAIRVVESMPKWKPGMQKGKAVRVSFNLPIKFTLN